MLSYENIQAFLYQEARAQAEKRWADWLACYADDVDYFMPSWDDDDTLTTDPHNEVSLIYYPSIETDRSSASTPDTRYNRAISNIEILAQDESRVDLCFNWTTHSFRYDIVDVYFGTARYLLDTSGPKPLIKKKYIVVKNDYIHHMLDVYHV
jgi:benzoate/toluate 1,2-dioxygenase subunit beta